MTTLALLLVALLFGGSVLYSFGFAAALFAAMLLATIAVSKVPARQVLMPAINAATDAGNKSRFKTLHGLSVLVTLVHIALAAWVLARFV